MEPILTGTNDSSGELPDVEEDIVTIDLPFERSQQLYTSFQIVEREEIKVEVVKYTTQTEYLVLGSEYYTLRIYHGSKAIEQVRSNHDLDWLSETVRTKYPGIGVQIHRLSVYHEDVQEKIKTVQLFLDFLLEHQLLKNCPEIAYFLSDSATYLSFKKEQDAEFAEQSARKNGFSFAVLRTYFKSTLSFTKSDNSNIQELLDKYQLRQLMETEGGIDSSIAMLERLLEYRVKSSQTKAVLLKNEASILQGDCEDLRDDIDNIRKQFAESEVTSRKESSFDYLNSGIYLQLVRDSLLRYKSLFAVIRSLLNTIALLKQEREFGEMHSRDSYLKLLTNNMKRDIDYWLKLNQALLQSALTQ